MNCTLCFSIFYTPFSDSIDGMDTTDQATPPGPSHILNPRYSEPVIDSMMDNTDLEESLKTELLSKETLPAYKKMQVT